MVRVELEVEAAAEDVLAEVAGGARFLERRSKTSYSFQISPWM